MQVTTTDGGQKTLTLLPSSAASTVNNVSSLASTATLTSSVPAVTTLSITPVTTSAIDTKVMLVSRQHQPTATIGIYC